MNIAIHTGKQSFGALIPSSQYKGPVLKLTSADKKKIGVLQKKVAEYEIELYKLNEIARGKRLTQEQNFYLGKIQHIEAVIEELKSFIREIKINRLNKQKAKLNKGLDETV